MQSTGSSNVEQVLAAQPDLVRAEAVQNSEGGKYVPRALQQQQAVVAILHALQESFRSLVQAANLSQLLASSNSSYTLFAPTDAAIIAAIANKAIPCQTDFEDDQPCTSLSAVLNSTGLSQLVLNHGKQAFNNRYELYTSHAH